MAFDFKTMLTEALNDQINATSRTMERLFHLSDRFLARELLRLAREARTMVQAHDHHMRDPFGITYDVSFLWHVIPEIAARLGETAFEANERATGDAVGRCGGDIRGWASSYLHNVGLGRRYGYDQKPVPNACLILTHDCCNGNPVAMAIDRIQTPDRDSTDWMACHMREVGRYRFGAHAEWNAWTPGFQHYKNKHLNQVT